MSKLDPLDEFGRLIKQVKVQEYERGWREAMEAIQRAAISLYRQSAVASEAAAAADDDASVARSQPAEAAEPPPPAEPSAPVAGEEGRIEIGSDGQQRFVTPKWALLKR